MISAELLWLALAISNIGWGFLYFCKSMDLSVAEQRLEGLRAAELTKEGWITTYFMGRSILIPPPPPRPKVQEIKEDSPKPLESPTSDLNKELVESIQQTNKLLKKAVKEFQKPPVVEEKPLEEMDEVNKKALGILLSMSNVKIKSNLISFTEDTVIRHTPLGSKPTHMVGDKKKVYSGYITIERDF